MVLALLMLGTSAAASMTPQGPADDAAAIQQAHTAWLLGDSSNALLAEDFCGEVVDGRFFLAVPLGTGAPELDCQIPAGVATVGSPFGAVAWAPTDGKTGTQLFNAALDYLDGVVPRSVAVTVDGVMLPKEPMLCSHPFTIALEPGNSLQQIDPNVTGDSTKVVSCGWTYLVDPLSPGQHTIDVGGRTKGTSGFAVRYNVTVA